MHLQGSGRAAVAEPAAQPRHNHLGHAVLHCPHLGGRQRRQLASLFNNASKGLHVPPCSSNTSSNTHQQHAAMVKASL